VEERVDSKGNVVKPLREEDVARCVEVFKREGVEAVAICFLNSYANAAHEQRVKELVKEALPGVYLAVSSEISPEFREFERSSTVTVVAYVGPVFQRYIEELQHGLEREISPAPNLYIMQSSGGMASAKVEVQRPHLTLESGPAAGVLATVDLGESLGFKDLISFDMGGTTAKASLIRGGKYSMVNMLEIGKEATGYYGIRVTGLPVRAPSIDLVECSAGGGSVAWVDVAGLLKVGPRSAGAVPGPVCYASGGTEPTVTDANVVLGRISPDFFLGGRMSLRPELSRKAMEEKVGRKLGMSADEAAQGILDIVNANMVRILRVVSVSRGYDPREFVLVAHGGAGPMHAGDLAEELEIGRIVIPPNPGLFSAMGLVISNIQTTAMATRFLRVEAENLETLRESLAEQEDQCLETLRVEGVPEQDQQVERFLEMRYVRQNFELEIPVSTSLSTADHLSEVVDLFHRVHHQSYGHSDPEAPVEVVNVKARGLGRIPKPKAALVPQGGVDPSVAFVGRRKVFFKSAKGWLDCPHYDRVKLLAGNLIEGPAMVCEFDSSVVVLPGHKATVGSLGELIIETGKGEA
jgi:N-methylhydantoinase A